MRYTFLTLVLPTKEGISWESHLFGAIVGLIVAFTARNVLEDEDKKKDPWADEDDQPGRYLLPRDTFDKTKAQRIAEERARRAGGWNSDIT